MQQPKVPLSPWLKAGQMRSLDAVFAPILGWGTIATNFRHFMPEESRQRFEHFVGQAGTARPRWNSTRSNGRCTLSALS